MRKHTFLFCLIFIEGYVVLATELLAIRSLIPFVGSGIEVTSIVIGAILLPLALGYHTGGSRAIKALRRERKLGGRTVSIRHILQINLFIALLMLSVGLSYMFQEKFFVFMERNGITSRIWQTTTYAGIFLVIPLYLLAQTVPLVSNYFWRTRLSEVTGRILFFSTAGSFLGSILSTLALMTFIGVHNTVIVTMLLLTGLIFLTATRKYKYILYSATCVAIAMIMANSPIIMAGEHNILANTPYSLVSIYEIPKEDSKIFLINRSLSSKYAPDPQNRFHYNQFIDTHFINTMRGRENPSILVLGAGGFMLGWDDKSTPYTFVDIDPALKDIAEEHLLPEPLPPNKKFIGTSARSFLHNTKEKYDLVIVDVFSNRVNMPVEAVTQEFWKEVKKVVKPGGIVLANAATSATYDDRFSVRYYNTFASVFRVFDRQLIGQYNAWSQGNLINTFYIYYNKPHVEEDRSIYTDDKNTYNFDY